MKVKPLINSKVVKDSWLDFDKIYIVLSISTFPDGQQDYLIWSEIQQSVGLFSINSFEIISPELSERWCIDKGANGCLIIGPPSWNQDGFWENYHDEVPEYIVIFEGEREKIEME